METERKIWPVALALGVVTFLVYCPVLTFGFVNYDDPQYILNNPPVKAGLSLKGIEWAFSSRYATNWHPLAWISHMLDCSIFGLNAWGHHLTSLLLHVANTVLLFSLLQKMTRAVWRSAFVAALFALHPLHVESVAWIAERKDVLSTFFFFLTVRAYVGYAQIQNEKLKIKNYLLALLFFTLGLLSKPMLVTLPFVLLLLDFWPLNRVRSAECGAQNWQRLVLEKIPFITLSLASCVVTLWAQQKTIMAVQTLPVLIRLFNVVLSYARYLKKIFCPTNLAVLYPYPGFWAWTVILALGIILLLLTMAIIRQRREQPYLAVGWFWFLGMLVPVIGLVQVGVQCMADRYTYLPAVGVFIIIAWGARDFFAARGYDLIILKALGVLAVVACAAATVHQSQYWRDGETLFKHTLAVTRDNAIAHYNLGMALLDQKKVDEAGEHFAEGARHMPHYPEMQNNLANVLVIQGKRKEAVPHYERALQSDSNHVVAHYNLGLTLAELDRLDEALVHYERAVHVRPDFLLAQRDLGLALAKKKDFPNAIAHLAEVTRANPNSAEARLFLGSVLADAGRTNEARDEFMMALQLKPGLPEQFLQEAFAAQKQGELNSAADRLSAVLKLLPDDAETHRQLAMLLSQQGKMEQSLAHFREVIRLQPENFRAYYEAGLALVMDGKREQAVGYYSEAVRLNPDFSAALNDLAWILATHPNKDIREGAKAVELAQNACKLSSGAATRFLGTLDAALAETGQFEKAIETAKQVREQALARGEPDLAEAAEKRLALYHEKKSFRQIEEFSRPKD